MATKKNVRETVLTALRKTRESDLEDLVNTCSDYTWNQIFLEVDRLSRTGEVRVRRSGIFGYRLSLSPRESRPAAR